MSDKPKEDKGDNFGRLSRAGVMDSYIKRLLQTTVSGIAAQDWIAFFTIFTESSGRDDIAVELRKMGVAATARREPEELAIRALSIVRELLAAVGAARLDDIEDQDAEDETLRAAIADRRRDLEDVIRVALAKGVDPKNAGKLGGITARAVEKITAPVTESESGQEAEPSPPTSGGEIAG